MSVTQVAHRIRAVTCTARSLVALCVVVLLALCAPATTGAQTTINKRIAAGSDDAEQEGPTGTTPNRMWLTSSDIELVSDFDSPTAGVQTIGLRFTSMTIPVGATITAAYLNFRAVSADAPMTNSEPTNLTIHGQLIANAPVCTTTSNNLGSRALTTASTSWTPGSWTTNTTYSSPSLISVIQEIVNQGGWASGNALAVIINGTGHRASQSYETNSSTAAELVVTYTTSTTTLATGTDPANTSIAPGDAATMVNAFSFQTSGGTDAITAVTVTLPAGTSGGLALVEITNNAGTVVYGSVANPGSDTPAITLTGLTATTTLTQYKIRITPRSHATMPVPTGSSYAVTAHISAWTGSIGQLGSDAAGTTVTIDNLSPANVTVATATAGNAQVALAWTNPVDADLSSTVVLRRATLAVGDTPVEGSTYTVGNTIGSSTVACVVTAPTASCTDTGLTNGTAYHYRVFARDANGNYAATGEVPTGSPATPAAPPPVLGLTNTVTPNGTQPPGTDLSYTITLTNSGGSFATDIVVVDSLRTHVDFKLGSVTSGLGTSGLTVTVAYSTDGAVSFAHTPVSGGGGAPAGYDRTVTHVRWTFTGNLSEIGPNNVASVGLTARIR